MDPGPWRGPACEAAAPDDRATRGAAARPLLWPTLAIVVSIVAANLLGDALGEILGNEKRQG